MRILHQVVVFEHCDPIFVVFHLFLDVGGAGWGHELLDRYRMRVKVLQGDV